MLNWPQLRPNVIGVAQTINAFLPLVRKGKEKKVLVVSSVMGSPVYAMKTRAERAVGYAISKAALNMIVAKYALACKDDGIVIVAVSPGSVKTSRQGESIRVPTQARHGLTTFRRSCRSREVLYDGGEQDKSSRS